MVLGATWDIFMKILLKRLKWFWWLPSLPPLTILLSLLIQLMNSLKISYNICKHNCERICHFMKKMACQNFKNKSSRRAEKWAQLDLHVLYLGKSYKGNYVMCFLWRSLALSLLLFFPLFPSFTLEQCLFH